MKNLYDIQSDSHIQHYKKMLH